MRVLIAISVAALLAFSGCLESAEDPAATTDSVLDPIFELDTQFNNFTGQVTGAAGLNPGAALSILGLAPGNVFTFNVASNATLLNLTFTGSSQAGVGEASIFLDAADDQTHEAVTEGLMASIVLEEPAAGEYRLRVFPSDDSGDQIDFDASIAVERMVEVELGAEADAEAEEDA